MTATNLSVHDPEFMDKIIFEVKSQGHFDAFRKECLADVDTQPAYQNLQSRVEDSVQSFLNRQVWTPETNRTRLREDMKSSIVRANYLDNGVSRIVDQIVEQRMESIQSKVEEILYKYAGLEQPIKQEVKQENGTLEVDTNLLPTDLEQVSPDSDKKSITEVSMDEEVEEEIIDDDFESPAFEPVEPMIIDKSENSQQSDLSAISGLTSHDSEKSEQPAAAPETQQMQQDNELSQISSTPEETTTQDRPDSVSMTGLSGDEAQMATSLNETSENDPKSEIAATAEPDQPQKSQFDLKKDRIEFTGTERKSLQLDDSTASGDAEKVLQSNDLKVPKEVENLYANDTTDSSEMRMEIDLKDESTQETVASSAKVEDSSQGSTKDKHRSDKKDNKSDRSKDRHRSSSHNKSSSHRHHSSSSKSNRHDDKHRNYKDGKSSSNHKKSSNDKDRSRRDHDKKSPKDESSRSNKNRDKNEEKKTSDDHQQEKPSSRRRRSTDHDSNEAKSATKEKSTNSGENLTAVAPAPSEVSKETSNVDQPKSDEQKEVESKPLISDDENQDSCRGFTAEELPHNPWFDILKRDIENNDKKKINNNYLDKKKMSLNFDIGSSSAAAKLKTKSKIKNLDSPGSPSVAAHLTNGTDEITPEQKAHAIAQQQRYNSDDLYKPRFDFGSRSRRRGQVVDVEDRSETVPVEKPSDDIKLNDP